VPLRPFDPATSSVPNDIDAADVAAIQIAIAAQTAARHDMVCANLAAQPTPLPNGDFQYPVVPCSTLNITAPLGVPVKAGERPAAAATQRRTGSVIPQPTANADGSPLTAGTMTMDMNALQYKRLGHLDAIQGRPLNMNYANSLGYMQGYTEGQQQRMSPQGGFGGIRR
jgi:hypothetical protein